MVVAREPERVERFVITVETAHERVVTLPERVFTVVVRFVRLVFVVLKFPESVLMFPVAVARFVLRVLMLVVCEAICPERLLTTPERERRFELVRVRFALVVAREPERVERFAFVVLKFPERVAILFVFVTV